jgi:hypothetical protein
MSEKNGLRTFWLGVLLLTAGCARLDLHPVNREKAAEIDRMELRRPYRLTPEAENRILALNPNNVSAGGVRGVLKGAPAPRIISIHGGIHPSQLVAAAFCKFLMGMGYPEHAVRHPGDGAYSISCYEEAKMIAGIIPWYYEREGMRPMIFGQSQGGMQAVKVLQRLARPPGGRIEVWNPLTWKPEGRYEITDPLTGKTRPAAGFSVAYVASLGAGGVTRALPNQWDMLLKLRAVPDTVDEFTGFYLGLDWLGGDNLGFGAANRFHATGSAKVRNVELPASYSHMFASELTHLLRNQEAVNWINQYAQTDKPKNPSNLRGDTRNILFGADVWQSVKRHWVIELQRLIRARRAQGYGR